MSLTLRRAAFFIEDFDRQVSWYVEQAGDTVDRRFMAAVWKSLGAIAAQPGMGKKRRFRHSKLKRLHSFRVAPPYDVHLIFYRLTESELIAERLMSGRRDLAQRLRERPGM